MSDIVMTTDDYMSFELVQIARKYLGGAQVRVKPFEKCNLVRVTDTQVILSFTTYLTRETRTRTVFTKSGVRGVAYDRVTAEKLMEMVLWDEECTAPDVATFGVRDAHEQTERMHYERDCYRPGSSRFPLDNATRTAAGSTTPSMTKHWS